MLQSAHRLLLGEVDEVSGGGPVPSRDRPILGESLKGKKFRFFMSIEAQRRMSLLPAPLSIAGNAYLLWHEDSRVCVLKDFETPEGRWEDTLPKSFRWTEMGQKARILVRESGFQLPTEKVAFREAVENETGCHWSEIDCLVVIDGLNVTAYEIYGEKSRPLSVVLHKDGESRLQLTSQELSGKKIALVGCGSLGSKLATTLARSGARSFILVDQDIFMPENLVRNDLDWRDVGRHKVDALSDRLGRVNPAIVTQLFRSELAGQTSSGAHSGMLDVLSDADVLIDATADGNVFNALSAVVARKPVAMLWGEVFAGGYGGMIARARPGLDPGPQTVRTTIRNWCDENGMPVEPSRGRYEGGDDAPSIADDSEVAVIAGHLSRFVIDVLTRPTESQYGQSAYMIGIGVGWIFNGPFETFPVDVGTPEEAISGDVDIAEQTAELVTIGQLLKEYSSGSTDVGRDN